MRSVPAERVYFLSAHRPNGHDRETLSSIARDPAPRYAGHSGFHLTPRQREVLALLCEGLPNKLICRRLNISAGTVKAHISSILRELGVATRLQAVVLARSTSLLDELGGVDESTPIRAER